MQAVSNGTSGDKSNLKVLEPKSFGGKRSAKELKNFLWDMETYFQAAKVFQKEKVSNITGMNLSSSAKLWWRVSISNDINANHEELVTQETLKKELKDQFLPCNTS